MKRDQVIKGEKALQMIGDELESACIKHPTFPRDVIHQQGIMLEEAGESIRAALRAVYEGKSVEEIQKELAQTGAMAIRCLINLPERVDGWFRIKDYEEDLSTGEWYYYCYDSEKKVFLGEFDGNGFSSQDEHVDLFEEGIDLTKMWFKVHEWPKHPGGE